MSRLQRLLLILLALGVPVAAVPTVATSSPVRVHAAPADDRAGNADDPSADDPADDSELDLGVVCDALSNPADDTTDPADDPADSDLGDLGTLVGDQPDPADATDPADVPDPTDAPSADDLGLDELCAEDPANEAADGGRLTVTLKDLLKRGKLTTGTVNLAGPGTVTQELWFPGAPTASAASVHRKAKAGEKTSSRLLGGKVRRTVAKAGVVHLSVQLNTAARKRLRAAKKDLRLTVRTTTQLKHGKSKTTIGSVTVRKQA